MKIRSGISGLILAALMTVPMLSLPTAQAQVGLFVSVHVAPPALPVYVQPPLPAPGYLWTPGYWAWGAAGYYWVPGVWVQPPSVGVLWTPGYWGFAGGVYGWHGGYWGPHVGFYGGVNYGFGYGGIGFCGGMWRGGVFAYNGAVANFGGVHVSNVYVDRTVVDRTTIINNNHVSFNGPGGVVREPSPEEARYGSEQHFQATANQVQHQNFAAQDRSQLASVNNGRPATMASANVDSYRSVAQEHAHSQPISAADRQAGQHYTPNVREANQDQRIANGLRSGQMTSGEAAQADRTQSHIDQQVARDRAANGGHLTNQEGRQIHQEQNAASRQIYNDNHNSNRVKPNAVDDREANQQQRTAQGLRSGQETSGEASVTNRNQARVDQQVHNNRAADGGAMNAQQKRQINREQNQNSKQIYNQKHNDKTAHPPTRPQGRGR